DNTELTFDGVAIRERTGEQPMIVATYVFNSIVHWVFSVDGGRTWKEVQVGGRLNYLYTSYPDTGGFYARSRYSNLRVGTHEFPFVAVISSSVSGAQLVAISSDGTSRPLLTVPSGSALNLIGEDRDRARYLVRAGNEIDIVDLNGTKINVGPSITGSLEGWITPNGAAYVEQWTSSADIALWLYSNGTKTFVDGTYDKTVPGAIVPAPPSGTSYPFFATPTTSYEGAWIVKRSNGGPTRLLESNSIRTGTIEHWSDITGPEVEAIHPAFSS